jgi:hypothetical protein
MKERASIYGATVEGYNVGLSLLREGYEVNVLDERIKTSFKLTDNAPTSIRQLVGEDSLYPIQPISSALQGSKEIILAPRLKYADEGRAEWLQRLKEIGQNLSENTTLVNMVPLSIGGNRETLMILEEQSGLTPGKEFAYTYLPAGGSGIAGYLGDTAPAPWMDKVFGGVRWSKSIEESEMQYIKWALLNYLPKVMGISFYREGGPSVIPENKIYLDDIAQGYYEMQLFSETLQHGETLYHFATGALKAVSGYTHTLGSYLRNYARERGLKAIRSKILLVWSHDKSEMKGERSKLLSLILGSLREVFGDVESWNPAEQTDDKKRPSNLERYQMIVPCSQTDLKLCKSFMRGDTGQSIITASVPVSLS